MTSADVPIAMPTTEMSEITLMTRCDFLLKKYRRAMNSGRFKRAEGLEHFIRDEILCDLDRIRGGAFAEIIRNDPHVQRTGL